MVEFFLDFSQKKGGKHKNLHHNTQSTSHWPKSFGLVFISRLEGAEPDMAPLLATWHSRHRGPTRCLAP